MGIQGQKGEKGDMGNPFSIKYIYDTITQFNLDKSNLNCEDLDYMIDNETGNVYQYIDLDWEYKFNVKGIKGYKGDCIQIDLIVDSSDVLLAHSDMINKYALIKTSLDLYKNIDNNWNLIGNLKGGKGPKGDRGDKGEIGKGLKIEKLFEISNKELINMNRKFFMDCFS